MDELRFQLTCALADDGRTLDLDVYSAIDQYAGDASNPTQARKAIREADGAELIRVRINSPGGFLTDALAIYQQLNEHPARVEVMIDGLAASSATVIAMAGDTIRMAEHAEFMIHEPYVMAVGDAERMQAMAERLDKEAEQMASLYAARTGRDAAEIRDLMRAETWMTSEEAFDAGFIDEVVPGKSAEVEERIAACLTAPAVRAAGIGKVPFRVAAKTRPQKSLPLPEGSAEPNHQPKRSNMKTIASALGLVSEATEAQIVQAINQQADALRQSSEQTQKLLAAAEAESVENALGVIEAGKAAAESLKAAQAKLEEQAKAAEAQEREAIIAKLEGEKRISPAQKAGFCASASIEALRAFAKDAPVIVAKTAKEPANGGTEGAAVNKSWAEMSNMERHNLFRTNREEAERLMNEATN